MASPWSNLTIHPATFSAPADRRDQLLTDADALAIRCRHRLPHRSAGSMTQAITIRRLGGPDVLEWGDVGVAADPGPGEIRVRQTAVGLNYADIYHRTGVYPLSLPAIPGIDGVGVVEAL